jgi:hypothetical protein
MSSRRSLQIFSFRHLVTHAIVRVTSSGQVGNPNRYGLVIIGQI